MAIRLVLAEDHLLVREGVCRLIEKESDLELLASCGDLPSLLTAIDGHRPDVVLTDIRMPPTGSDEGLKAAEHLREHLPEAGIVLLSQYADPQYALRFLANGSQGRAYLLKERLSGVNQLLSAIRAVARQESWIDSKVVDALVTARSRSRSSPLRYLTRRELQILSEMAQGKSNAGIAAALVLSDRAVAKHIGAIFSKLGVGAEPDVSRRVKAVLLFLGEHPN